MGFLKCRKCNHIDVSKRFTCRGGQSDLPQVCPNCYNDKHNIVEMGDEVSCNGCIYNAVIPGSCSHPDNTPDSDFWSRPQETCFTSRLAAPVASGTPETGRNLLRN